jgi:nucleotide-binding universal stress UspA family protein
MSPISAPAGPAALAFENFLAVLTIIFLQQHLSLVAFGASRPVPGDAGLSAVTVTEPFHVLSLAPSELEYTPTEYKEHAETHAEKVLGAVSAAAKSAGVVCEMLHVEHEQVYQAIIDAASARRCDLIVMASHGRRGVSAVVLGSETVKVLTHSKIPVLVYR